MKLRVGAAMVRGIMESVPVSEVVSFSVVGGTGEG